MRNSAFAGVEKRRQACIAIYIPSIDVLQFLCCELDWFVVVWSGLSCFFFPASDQGEESSRDALQGRDCEALAMMTTPRFRWWGRLMRARK